MEHDESRPRDGDGSRTSATKSFSMMPCRRDDAAVPRFGQPSTYSLTRRELSRHIRELRRAGWQSWEVRARFDYWPAS